MGEFTIGLGGADGGGLARCRDAATCLGLHADAYNCYQSVIRSGRVWLTLRLALAVAGGSPVKRPPKGMGPPLKSGWRPCPGTQAISLHKHRT